MSKNPYDILGVSKSASESEVKKAYRRLANKYHPDKNQGDKAAEQKFKEVSNAYEILSDPKKKQMYDQFGSTGGPSGAGFNPNDFANGFDFGASNFADIFETFFGGQRSQSQKKSNAVHGENIQINLQITFEEAVFGVEKEIKVRLICKCTNCNASGAEPGTKITSCKKCSGTGQIKTVRQTILGQMVASQTCPDCQGMGQIPEFKCKKCSGALRHAVEKQIKIKVPAGIHNGATIRLNGMGNQGVDAPDGDLYVKLSVARSNKFERDGADVISTLKIEIPQAVLGDTVKVDTVHGPKELQVDPGTTCGQEYVLKGQGAPLLRGFGHGNHIIRIKINIPAKPNKKLKELYLQVAAECGLDLKSKKSGLLW